MAYTNKGKIQNYINTDISVAFDDQLTEWISAVTQWIDKYTGKSFEASSDTKYYNGSGTDCLDVDSFVGNPTVLILNTDGTTDVTLTEGHADDYLTYPLNSTEKTLLVLSPSATISAFPSGKRRVSVTANFGYSTTVPEDISLIATKLVGNIIEKGLKGGKVAQEELGDYRGAFEKIDEQADALAIYQTLDMYRDIQI